MFEIDLLLFYLLENGLEEPQSSYGFNWEERETGELLTFIRCALKEIERRGVVAASSVYEVRISRTLRIFIGGKELKLRPMAKTVLLLFLHHPEGIVLKNIADYQEELAALYRRVTRSSEPAEIERRILRITDLFNNDLNVNIARVNRAMARLVDTADAYRIDGSAGQLKSLRLDRTRVVWD